MSHVTTSIRRRARASVPTIGGMLVAAALCSACLTTKPQPGGRLSPSEQVLASEAVDRAVDRLEWPDVDGKKVHVSVAAPSGDPEKKYLETAVSAELVERGAVLTPDSDKARYELLVLADAVGVEETSTFFGLPAAEGSLIPVALPEIALYDASRAEGYAKVEIVLTDLKQGGIVARSGPMSGDTSLQKRRVLLFKSRDSDTPEATKLSD